MLEKNMMLFDDCCFLCLNKLRS